MRAEDMRLDKSEGVRGGGGLRPGAEGSGPPCSRAPPPPPPRGCCAGAANRADCRTVQSGPTAEPRAVALVPRGLHTHCTHAIPGTARVIEALHRHGPRLPAGDLASQAGAHLPLPTPGPERPAGGWRCAVHPWQPCEFGYGESRIMHPGGSYRAKTWLASWCAGCRLVLGTPSVRSCPEVVTLAMQ